MKDNKNRVRFIGALCVLFALILVGRLYSVQILSGATFKEKADRQYTQPQVGVFDRGTVYFTSKDGSEIAVATLKSGFTLAINPKLITDPEMVYSNLNNVIPINHDDFIKKAGKSEDPYEEILKKVPEDKAIIISKLGIDGVGLYEEKWRYYPGDSMGAHLLGFVGFNKDVLSGRYGIEKYYDDVLTRSQKETYVNFFAEIISGISKTISDEKAIEGDVVLTIEPNVQNFLENEIKQVQEKFSSKISGGIVMDPKTGEIIAMAGSPSFNPNSYQTEKNLGVFTNPLVQNVYEMGSIVKPLTMAAGIDTGTVTANTTYDDKGFLILNGKTFYNFDKKARGIIDMQEVLNQSLNTGAAYVVGKMGNASFAKYMFDFGLGEKTGIDLPNEADNLMSNLRSNIDLDYAQASFGQGIAITPVSIIRALGILANNGKIATPHVTKEINYSVGYSKVPTLPSQKQIIKPETAQEVSRMLTEAVDKALLNGKYKNENYSVAAKTGTAQIAKPGGGYYEDRNLHSFFGYFPSYAPRFVIFLFTTEPQGELYASHTLTAPFMNLTKYLINYYEIPPDR